MLTVEKTEDEFASLSGVEARWRERGQSVRQAFIRQRQTTHGANSSASAHGGSRLSLNLLLLLVLHNSGVPVDRQSTKRDVGRQLDMSRRLSTDSPTAGRQSHGRPRATVEGDCRPRSGGWRPALALAPGARCGRVAATVDYSYILEWCIAEFCSTYCSVVARFNFTKPLLHL